MGIKVSVVISSYNYAGYLRKAVDSVLTQDYENGFEVIVVDDASTDDSEAICKSYGEKIIYLKNDHNLGVSATRNRGAAIAKGEYICTLDADDSLLPRALKWYARTLDNFPFVGLVYGDLIRVNEIEDIEVRHKSPDFDRKLLELRNIVYCSSQMFRKECLKVVGGYDDKIYYVEDYDLWLRMTERFKALHIPVLIEKRSLKLGGLGTKVREEGTLEKFRRYVNIKMRKRKLINSIKSLCCCSPLKDSGRKLEEARMRQALNQCDFILREIFPKKVLIVEDTPSCLAIVFKRKGIEVVSVSKEDLTGVSNPDRDFDLIVLWNVLESFPEEETEKIIGGIIKSRPKTIVLLVETKEFYDGAYDNPTRPRHWWIENFTPRYKVIEPKAGRPVINEDNWFYNYGLDKVMFFKRQDNT